MCQGYKQPVICRANTQIHTLSAPKHMGPTQRQIGPDGHLILIAMKTAFNIFQETREYIFPSVPALCLRCTYTVFKDEAFCVVSEGHYSFSLFNFYHIYSA